MYGNVNLAKKRKASEYRDPDYSQENETDTAATTATQCENLSFSERPAVNDNAKDVSHEAPTTSKQALNEEMRLQRVREIVDREFEREIKFHTQRLEEVDQSIEEAIKIFDKLRYTLVTDYYNKQEIELSNAEAAQLRGENTLFTDEPNGPQLPMHSSLQNIIGKRPVSLSDILRLNPKRTAAQNAQQRIDEVTNASSRKQQRREERRKQKMIRDEGIVIDHSKPASDSVNAQITDLEQAMSFSPAVCSSKEKTISTLALNATRLNNKIKHFIVVGNTSQYIGEENSTARGNSSVELAGQRVTHKWLVYVQAKDPIFTPLESLVKKIRFHLHPSYRPNDVVDITSTPFQLTRRGWGEFPVRLQIYFHEDLQQKPVQLQHNLVLDKALTGMQTIGAETLVEIWLRPLAVTAQNSTITQNKIHDTANNNNNNHNNKNEDNNDDDNQKELHKNKKRTISVGQINDDLMDDNIFEFLNRIDATPSSLSADIEKLQPTVNLNESLGNIITSPTKSICGNESPVKTKNYLNTKNNKSPIKNLFTAKTTAEITKSTTPTKTITTSNLSTTTTTTIISMPITTTTTTKIFTNNITTAVPIITKTTTKTMPKQTTSPTTSSITSSRPLKPYPQPVTPKPSIICLNTLNSITSTVNTRTITTTTTTTPKIIGNNRPIVLPQNIKFLQINKTNTNTNINTRTPIISGEEAVSKRYEKKLVQLVDAQGKIKYVQMLVASKKAPATIIKNVPTIRKTATTTTATTTTTTTTMPLIVNNSNKINVNINNNLNLANATTLPFPKNTLNVFQKEGKLYIRDPMQMKLKQQQKQQMSLLKPQVSLLKQNQQSQKHQTTTLTNDHDYAPLHTKVKTAKTKSFKTNFNQIPHIVEDTEICPSAQLKVSFQRIKFNSMRAAVEFLLRRLTLIATNNNNNNVSAKLMQKSFVFMRCSSVWEFQHLPAFKQRACEWLRAKYICNLLNEHVHLKQLTEEGNEVFWTTREIVIFARWHAYTPSIKSLSIQATATEQEKKQQEFAALLRNEVNLEQAQVQLQTLSTPAPILAWIKQMQAKLQHQEMTENHELEVDVVGDAEIVHENRLNAVIKQQNILTANLSDYLIMPVPRHLEIEAELVHEICSSIRIPLNAEQVVGKVHQPLVQIILAHCLRVFVGQLLSRAVATRAEEQQEKQPQQQLLEPDLSIITMEDIGKALLKYGRSQTVDGNNVSDINTEYDFLTNCYFGAPQANDDDNDEDMDSDDDDDGGYSDAALAHQYQ